MGGEKGEKGDDIIMVKQLHKKLSRLQRRNVVIVATIIVILTVAVAVAIALGVTLGVSKSANSDNRPEDLGVTPGESNSNNSDTCQTESCVKLTAQILTGLDPSVDPCEDFYEFSCGLWANNTNIPEGM